MSEIFGFLLFFLAIDGVMLMELPSIQRMERKRHATAASSWIPINCIGGEVQLKGMHELGDVASLIFLCLD